MKENEEEIIPDESSETEEDIVSEEESGPNITEVDSIPNDATVFDQTHWAWLLPSSVWIILLSAVIVYDFISMGFIPLLMAIAIVVPRYLRWKQTKYYLSNDSLYTTMVGIPLIQKKRTFKIPFDDMVDTNIKYGTFGKTLGYAEVQTVFSNGRVAKFQYLANYSDFVSHIETRTDLPGAS